MLDLFWALNSVCRLIQISNAICLSRLHLSIIMLAIFKRKKRPPKPCSHQRNSSLTQSVGAVPVPLTDTQAPERRLDVIAKAPKNQVDVGSCPNQLSEKQVYSTEACLTLTPCAVCKEEKRTARRYRWTIIFGLVLPFCLQGLDATIIAGALPFIASDFRQLSRLPGYLSHKIIILTVLMI